MPISIAGSGTITGISAGGLPDDCITTAEIAANAVTYAKIGTTEQGQLCKAWVYFNGTSTVAIRGSYNVSSITDNGTGDYTVNFSTAMADANYAYSLSLTYSTTSREAVMQVQTVSAASIRVLTGYSYTSPGAGDVGSVAVAIFR